MTPLLKTMAKSHPTIPVEVARGHTDVLASDRCRINLLTIEYQ